MAVNFGSSGDFRRGRDLGLQGAIATSQNNREVEEEFNLKQAGRINSFNVNLVAKLQKQFGTDHPLVDEHIAAGSVPTWNTLNAIYPDAGSKAEQLNYIGASLALTPPGEATRRISRVEQDEDGMISMFITVDGEEGEFPFTEGGTRVKDGGEERVFTEQEFNNMLSQGTSRQLTEAGQAGAGTMQILTDSLQDTQTDDYSAIRNIGNQPIDSGGAVGLGNMSRAGLETQIRGEIREQEIKSFAEGIEQYEEDERKAALDSAPETVQELGNTYANATLEGEALFNSIMGPSGPRSLNDDKGDLRVRAAWDQKVMGSPKEDRVSTPWTEEQKKAAFDYFEAKPGLVNVINDARVGPYGIDEARLKTMTDRQRRVLGNRNQAESEGAAIYRLENGTEDGEGPTQGWSSLQELDRVEQLLGSFKAGNYTESDPIYGNEYKKTETQDAIEFWKDRDDIAAKVLSKHPFYNEEYKKLGPVAFALKYKDDENYKKNFMTPKEITQSKIAVVQALIKSNANLNLLSDRGNLTEQDFKKWGENNKYDAATDALMATEIKKLYDTNTKSFNTTHLTTKNRKALALIAYHSLPASIKEKDSATGEGTYWRQNLQYGALYGTTSTDIASTMAINEMQQKRQNLQLTKRSIEAQEARNAKLNPPKDIQTTVEGYNISISAMKNINDVYRNDEKGKIRENYSRTMSQMTTQIDNVLDPTLTNERDRNHFMSVLKMGLSIEVQELANSNLSWIGSFFYANASTGMMELGSDVQIYQFENPEPVRDLSDLMKNGKLDLSSIESFEIKTPGKGTTGDIVTIGQIMHHIGDAGVKFIIAEAIENAKRG